MDLNDYDLNSSEQSNEDTLTLANIKENDLNQLISILSWYKQVEPSYLDKLYEKIIKSRSQLILDALKRFFFID
jgi:hypothetical protein